MKRLRSLLALGLIAVLLISLTACGTGTASDQVKKDIKEIQNAEISTSIFDDEDSEFTDADKEAYGVFLERLSDFDCEIGEEIISEDGNSATVELSVTTYDYGTAYLDVWDEIVDGKVKINEETTFYTVLFAKFNELDDKDFTTKVIINCTKDEDGNWSTDIADNTEFKKAIFGDLVQVVSSLANM
ncbi:MAG: hypothetical protein KBS68_04250 [Clostridiales bacterium]|nr:hypothetical protein [Candidatus Crickella merdequi]